MCTGPDYWWHTRIILRIIEGINIELQIFSYLQQINLTKATCYQKSCDWFMRISIIFAFWFANRAVHIMGVVQRTKFVRPFPIHTGMQRYVGKSSVSHYAFVMIEFVKLVFRIPCDRDCECRSVNLLPSYRSGKCD